MPQDILGNPVSAMRGATLGAVDDFIEGYLAYETRAEGIAAADPAIQSGQYVAAQQNLELLRAADPEGVPVNTALAELDAELGLAELAGQAEGRAADTRRRHAV